MVSPTKVAATSPISPVVAATSAIVADPSLLLLFPLSSPFPSLVSSACSHSRHSSILSLPPNPSLPLSLSLLLGCTNTWMHRYLRCNRARGAEVASLDKTPLSLSPLLSLSLSPCLRPPPPTPPNHALTTVPPLPSHASHNASHHCPPRQLPLPFSRIATWDAAEREVRRSHGGRTLLPLSLSPSLPPSLLLPLFSLPLPPSLSLPLSLSSPPPASPFVAHHHLLPATAAVPSLLLSLPLHLPLSLCVCLNQRKRVLSLYLCLN